MSKAQQKAFKVDQQQLQAAKKIFSVQDTFNTELGEDQVLKDEGFKIQAFNNDFTYLQAHKAKFAATIKDKATLLDREVKAVALVKAATTGDPDQTKIDQARDAINAVGVKAFKDKYLPKLDDAIKNLPKDQQAEQAKKQAVAGDSQKLIIPVLLKQRISRRLVDNLHQQVQHNPKIAVKKHNRLLAKCLAFPSSAKKQPERRRVVKQQAPWKPCIIKAMQQV